MAVSRLIRANFGSEHDSDAIVAKVHPLGPWSIRIMGVRVPKTATMLHVALLWQYLEHKLYNYDKNHFYSIFLIRFFGGLSPDFNLDSARNNLTMFGFFLSKKIGLPTYLLSGSWKFMTFSFFFQMKVIIIMYFLPINKILLMISIMTLYHLTTSRCDMTIQVIHFLNF